MALIKDIIGMILRLRIILLIFPLISFFLTSCNHQRGQKDGSTGSGGNSELSGMEQTSDEYNPVYSLLISPEKPRPGDTFRIVATGGKDILKAKIVITGPSGDLKPLNSKTGDGFPCWRVDEFKTGSSGMFKVALFADKKEFKIREFQIHGEFRIPSGTKETKSNMALKVRQGWDPGYEELYSAWINALFDGCGEDSSWPSLTKIIQNRQQNFLFNHLSLNEDDPEEKNGVVMQPDCADNPFFLRAYFAWKLGLPFGYHVCDRGSLAKNPGTGEWVTNNITAPVKNPTLAFNFFLRKLMNGVHSGTARTSFDNDRSDYYPVSLEKSALRPGVVFADPYGHTLVIVGWSQQTSKYPGMLLAVDAQPDGTVGIKRFWKGNFLFNTSEVIGEPGFKAFRPILMEKGAPKLLKNEELISSSGFIPFSLQQRKMESDVFYRSMERLINPKPLDPEAALTDLVKALHEQLLVRVTSVANGEEYMRSHPGTVIPMPSNAAGLFQTGGQWENYSTPNRDLRLLIAMDAVLGFPDKAAQSPGDFKISGLTSPEKINKELQKLLDQMVSDQFITYTRSDGSSRELTLREILDRKEAFEMAYNPNDGIEIRWGEPENSEERATCKRFAPVYQLEKMKSLRKWFQKRLHPPT
jgi:hypothetical protein